MNGQLRYDSHLSGNGKKQGAKEHETFQKLQRRRKKIENEYHGLISADRSMHVCRGLILQLNNLHGMLENIFFFLFEDKKNERGVD